MIFSEHMRLSCAECITGHKQRTCTHVERIKEGKVFVLADQGRKTKSKNADVFQRTFNKEPDMKVRVTCHGRVNTDCSQNRICFKDPNNPKLAVDCTQRCSNCKKTKLKSIFIHTEGLVLVKHKNGMDIEDHVDDVAVDYLPCSVHNIARCGVSYHDYLSPSETGNIEYLAVRDVTLNYLRSTGDPRSLREASPYYSTDPMINPLFYGSIPVSAAISERISQEINIEKSKKGYFSENEEQQETAEHSGSEPFETFSDIQSSDAFDLDLEILKNIPGVDFNELFQINDQVPTLQHVQQPLSIQYDYNISQPLEHEQPEPVEENDDLDLDLDSETNSFSDDEEGFDYLSDITEQELTDYHLGALISHAQDLLRYKRCQQPEQQELLTSEELETQYVQAFHSFSHSEIKRSEQQPALNDSKFTRISIEYITQCARKQSDPLRVTLEFAKYVLNKFGSSNYLNFMMRYNSEVESMLEFCLGEKGSQVQVEKQQNEQAQGEKQKQKLEPTVQNMETQTQVQPEIRQQNHPLQYQFEPSTEKFHEIFETQPPQIKNDFYLQLEQIQQGLVQDQTVIEPAVPINNNAIVIENPNLGTPSLIEELLNFNNSPSFNFPTPDQVDQIEQSKSESGEFMHDFCNDLLKDPAFNRDAPSSNKDDEVEDSFEKYFDFNMD